MFSSAKCPKCRIPVNPIEHNEPVGHVFANMIGAEIAMYLIAGILFAVGMQWPPALFVGIVLVGYIFLKKSKKMQFSCKKCETEFTYEELYK